MNKYPESTYPLFYVWSIIKLAYWHIVYVFVGVPEEAFHIAKANIFVELHWYERAINNYKKALRDSKNVRIYSMLGYCYSKIGRYDNAAEHYREAHKKSSYPGDIYGLALAEYQTGNIEKSHELLQELRKVASNTFTSNQKEAVDDLEARIASVKKERGKYNA